MKTDAEIIKELRLRVRSLEIELNKFRDEESVMKNAFAGKLSRLQLALLMAISKKDVASYAYLDRFTEEYGIYNRNEGEMHISLRTRVGVWKLRRKLKPYGIEIHMWRSIGYYMDDENKAKLKAMMEKKDAE